MVNKLLAVIVLYGIRLENSLTFQSINEASKKSNIKLDLIVYDNSPIENTIFNNTNNINIIYKSDYYNSGISKAYNFAAEYATLNDKNWLLFLDQDSKLPSIFFDIVKDSFLKFPQEQLFVPVLKNDKKILSPCKFKYMKGSAFKSIDYGLISVKDKSIFNSGILVSLLTFNSIGGYDERIPLDFSDHAFFHRYKKIYSKIVVMPINIVHELSSFSKDKEIILRRFKQYCFGVKAYSSIESGGSFLFFWTSLRAIKLSLQYKSFDFVKELLKR
jgi:rhamnosyltransferase